MKKYLYCLLLAICFTGCVYEESQDYSKYINKTNYESFDDLNDPLILNLTLDMVFNSTSNKKSTKNIKNGSLYVIYDWENEKIHDYVYAPGYSSRNLSDLSAMISARATDGKLKFYAIDDNEYKCLYILDSSKTSLSKISDINTNWSLSWSQTFIPSNRYLISYQHSDVTNSDSQVMNFIIVDSDSDTIYTELSLPNISSSHDCQNLIQDSDGTFWLLYLNKSEDSSKKEAFVRNINPSSQKIEDVFLTFDCYQGKTYSEEDDWNGYINYYLLSQSDDYLFFCKEDYCKEDDAYTGTYSFFTVDKESKTQTDYTFSDLNGSNSSESLYIKSALEFNDKFYLIVVAYVNEKKESCIYELDPANNSLTQKISLGSYDDNFIQTFAQRENKIFIVSYSVDNTNAEILSYDISSNTLSQKKKISLSDL